MADDTIDRNVYFYRIYVHPAEDGSVPELSIRDALNEVDGLEFVQNSTDINSRYSDAGNATVAAWPLITGAKNRLGMGRIRRTDLPGIEDRGKIKRLDLARTAGVVDTTHIQFFANGIVGAEYNFYGPRATGFSAYCQEKLPGVPHFRLHPLLNRKAMEQLNSIEDVRLVSIRIKPSHLQLLSQIQESLPDAFEAVAGQFGVDAIDVVLRGPKKKSLRRTILTRLKALIRSTDTPADAFEAFHVRGTSAESGEVEMFDLLRDRFIVEKTVAKMPGRTRRVDSDSMFSAIEQAYNANRSELESAPALGIDQ